jgi:hypothetical protein
MATMTLRVEALRQSRLAVDLSRWARPARDGAFLAGILFAVLIGLGILPFAVDAHAYWASNPLDPYHDAVLSDFDAYFYSPAFTQAFGPLHALPWTWFAGLWTLLLVATLAWLSDRWLALVILLPPVFIEIAVGNVHLLLAAAIVLGFRWPATWAFVLLTKVTPGIGLLWFVARREWRQLAIALGATAIVAGISFAIAPGLWSEWFSLLASRSAAPGGDLGFYTAIPLLIRVPAAAVLIVWAARTDRPWIVPIAAVLALPVLWPNSYAVAVGAIAFLTHRWLAPARLHSGTSS